MKWGGWIGFVLIAVAAVIWSSRPSRIALPGTNLTISVPDGFEHNTHVYTHHPSLHFSLVTRSDGRTPGYPTLLIERIEETHGLLSPASFVTARTAAVGDSEILLGPISRTIAGEPAVELAYKSQIIADFVGGGSDRYEIVSHEIIFSHDKQLYRCELESIPSAHKRCVEFVRSLCESIRYE